MPQDTPPPKSSPHPRSNHPDPDHRTRSLSLAQIFTLPPPLKTFFNLFPLLTLPANELPPPIHPRDPQRPTLYIFTTASASSTRNRPSFNPGCLKWQTYLKFLDVDFDAVPSNNHASPSGALPFLLPPPPPPSPSPSASASTSKPSAEKSPSKPDPSAPIPSSKLQKWALAQSGRRRPSGEDNTRFEAYMSLIDGSIRAAWLYTLYLSPSNTPLLQALYIHPTTTSALLRTHLLASLRSAARAELSRTLHTTTTSTPTSLSTTLLSPKEIFAGARNAFQALSTLLGDDEWFFGAQEPGLLDAAVFAYAGLALDEGFGWRDWGMWNAVEGCGNLRGHRERVLRGWYAGAGDREKEGGRG